MSREVFRNGGKVNNPPLSDVLNRITLKCLSIGTPITTINFPFVPNGKLMVSRCPNI